MNSTVLRCFYMTKTQVCPKCKTALPTDAPGGVCPQCVLGMAAESSPATQAPTNAGAPISVEELSSRLPQLEIIELIGQGGMGAVYKAKQPSLGRIVAIKVLPPEFAKDPTFAERFAREVRTLGQLSHPNIVSVYDSGEVDGLHYFIMEYVDGLNLRQLMHAGELAPSEALAIVPQICEALQYAHDSGVIHRDVKPENIMIDSNGRVKVADFGLAKLVQNTPENVSLTMSQQVMGTWRYMAPEQIEKPDSVDHRSDIYALGVVLYELLTGNLPVGRFQLPSEKRAVAVGLDRVVLKALEHEMDKRYQRVSAIKTDIEVAATTPPPQRPSQVKNHANLESTDSATEYEEAKTSLAIPGWGLIFVGAMHCVMPIFGVISSCAFFFLISFDGSNAPTAALGVMEIIIILAMLAIWAPAGAIAIMGGRRMLVMKGKGWAIAGCIAAMLPIGPGSIIGLAFGIWGLVLLSRSKISRCFDRNRNADPPHPGASNAPAKEPLRDHGMAGAHRTNSAGTSAAVIGCAAVVLIVLLVIPIGLVASLFAYRTTATNVPVASVTAKSVDTSGIEHPVAATLLYRLSGNERVAGHEMLDALNLRLNLRRPLCRIQVENKLVTLGVYNDKKNVEAVKTLLADVGKVEFTPLAHAVRDKEIVELAKTQKEQVLLNGRIAAKWVEFPNTNKEEVPDDWVIDDSGDTTRVLVLQNVPSLTNEDIRSCKVASSGLAQPQLEFEFRNDRTVEAITDAEFAEDEEPLFVGFLMDDQLILGPRVRSKITNKLALTGDFTKDELQVWADIINGGPLPGELTLVLEQPRATQ